MTENYTRTDVNRIAILHVILIATYYSISKSISVTKCDFSLIRSCLWDS